MSRVQIISDETAALPEAFIGVRRCPSDRRSANEYILASDPGADRSAFH